MSSLGNSNLYLVNLIHNILHLNSQLKPVSHDFALSPSKIWNDYTLSVSVVPIIIACLGILSILIFLLTMIIRSWCGSCKCSPGNRYNPDGTVDKKVWVSYGWFHTSSLTSYYYVSVIWIFVSIQGILIAYVFFINPYTSAAQNSTTDIANRFGTLSGIGTIFQNEEISLSNRANDCAQNWIPSQTYSTFKYEFQGYLNASTEYIDFINPVSKNINQTSTYITLYGKTDFTTVAWTVYAACIFALILLQIGVQTSNRKILLGAIGYSLFFMLCYVIIGAALMFGLMLLSDYCVSPTANTLSLVSPSSSIYPAVDYFLNCSAPSPFTPIEKNLNNLLFQMNSTVKYCGIQNIRTEMYTSLDSSRAATSQIQNNIQCSNITLVIDTILQEDICNNIFTGFLIIWISHFFTLAGLYIAVLVTSIMCQNYGRFWNFVDGKEVPYNPAAEAAKSNKTESSSDKAKSGREGADTEAGESSDPMDIRISTRRPLSAGIGMSGDDEGRFSVKQTMSPNAPTLISSLGSRTPGKVMSLASQDVTSRGNPLTRPLSRPKQVPLNVQSASDETNGTVYKL